MTTERQRESNRINAQKSTGPQTEAGKAQSRLNAVKHALTARVVAIPGEDHEASAERMDHWQAELNSVGSHVLGYFVAMTVRETIKLDRCDAISTARTAQLARDAVKARKESRFRDVEACRRLFDTEPDVAVRRLRTTVEGIDHLLEEWDLLTHALLTDLPDWDKFDGLRMSKLRGTWVGDDHPGPDPSRLCTKALTEHREVKSRLERNDAGYWSDHYPNETSQERDRDRLPTLAATALQARDETLALIAREVAALRSLRAELDQDDQIDILEASDRLKFDASDEGKLLRRYETDIQRGLFRSMEEIRKQKKTEQELTEVDPQKDLMDAIAIDATLAAEEAPARNEAKSGPGLPGLKTLNAWEHASSTGMTLDFTVGKGPKLE